MDIQRRPFAVHRDLDRLIAQRQHLRIDTFRLIDEAQAHFGWEVVLYYTFLLAGYDKALIFGQDLNSTGCEISVVRN